MQCPFCDHRYRARIVTLTRRGARLDQPHPMLAARDFHACLWCVERFNRVEASHG
jgi:hypothetical protein